ncbi:ABC transporter permease [Nocardia sp. NPDC019395]|uniref:ABC transporter permease n=1 Tax=Nocardia sp. NPDC019395 TaxID=3154686 RepID=UPI003410D883
MSAPVKATTPASGVERPGHPPAFDAAGKKRKPEGRALVWSLRLGTIALILGSWELCASMGVVDELFTSKPSAIAVAFWNLLPNGQIWQDTFVTVTEVLLGFSLSAVAGILVGLVLSSIRVLADALEPILNALNTVPRIALIPLFVAWFGLGVTPRIVLAFTIAFFIMATTVTAALASPNKDLQLLAKSLGATRRQTMLKFVLPGATPVIASGLQLSLIYSFLGVIAAEIVSGSAGLGTRMTAYANSFQAASYFAVLVILTIVSTILTTAIRRTEKRLLRWHAYESAGN